jgi:hypothetical protein
MKINRQYNIAAASSLAVKFAHHQRRKMYSRFVFMAAPTEADTIADVGVTSDREYSHSNYFEAWYPHKSRITAVGLDDARFIEAEYPGVTFISADGCNLPFDDNSFCFAHSSAVLEHVGNRERQICFIKELWRVARKGIFVTTPNRWFPIEFHTLLPLLHWLPPKQFRRILKQTGREFFALEENLNLLSHNTLLAIARAASLSNIQISTVSLIGYPTNLLLFAAKAN